MNPTAILGSVCVAAAVLPLALWNGLGWDRGAALAVSLTGAVVVLMNAGASTRLERLPLGTLGRPDPSDPHLTAARTRYIGRVRPLLLAYSLYAAAVSLAGSALGAAWAAGAVPRWNDWPALIVGWAVAGVATIGIPSGTLGIVGGIWQARERRRMEVERAAAKVVA